MRALRRRIRRADPEPEVQEQQEQRLETGSEMCERGEHELTPAIVHQDRSGRKHCRACWAKYGAPHQSELS